jgi:hypothetical protein
MEKGQGRSSNMAKHEIARRATDYAIAATLLCLPAIWNGFPIMFDDVGGYLERWPSASLGFGRSAVYGLLLWITRSVSFFPAILLQASATTFVIDCAIRNFVPARPRWLLVGAIAALSATSGVALFVSRAMPDVWAALAVLALHLLAWHADHLSKFERIALSMIVAFAGAAHMATLAVLTGLSIVYGIAWLARRKLVVAPGGFWPSALAAWSGLFLLLAVDFIVAGRFALTPGGEVFLFGGLVADGTAGEILAEECPRVDWQLCSYRKELPASAEAFIFDGDGPLQKIGGWQDPRALKEIASIIERSLVRHPLEQAAHAVALTAQQFVDVGIGEAMSPLTAAHARWTLTLYAPSILPYFDTARQQAASIDLSTWSQCIVAPVSLAASCMLPIIGVILWRRNRRREAVLPLALFLALLGNAAVCGVASHPDDRYQARLAWLAVLAVGLSGQGLAQRDDPGDASSAVSSDFRWAA